LKETRVLPYFGLLRGVRWLEIDVSALHIGPISKGQSVQEEKEEEEEKEFILEAAEA
jgi:hypothetical protein